MCASFVAERPVFPAGQVFYVDENVASGTAVGQPMYAADQDVGQSLVFSLLDGPGSLFVVDGCSGLIKVNSPALNFGAYMSTVPLVSPVQSHLLRMLAPSPRLSYLLTLSFPSFVCRAQFYVHAAGARPG